MLSEHTPRGSSARRRSILGTIRSPERVTRIDRGTERWKGVAMVSSHAVVRSPMAHAPF